jgi:hypothetical protein
MGKLSPAETIIGQARKQTRFLAVNARNVHRNIETVIRIAERAGKQEAAKEMPYLLHQLTELQRQMNRFAASAELIERTTFKELQAVAAAARAHDD